MERFSLSTSGKDDRKKVDTKSRPQFSSGRSIIRRILRFIVPVFLGIAAGTALMVLFEEKLIYFPYKYPDGNWQPETYGLKAEDCFFTTSDGLKLHGWFFRVDNPRATMLWCHGNAGNITHRLDNIQKLLPLGINVFIFDYRGYGRSEGEPSEEGLYADARAAYDFLTGEKSIRSDSIVVFGRSIGSVVAVDLAAERPCRGLILESSFPSAKAMARELFPFLPLHLFLRSRFDADSKIARIKVPILFIHGIEDRTVPIHLGKQLFERANQPKTFYEIRGADHNDTYLVGGAEYFRRLKEFVSQIFSPSLKGFKI